MSRVTNVMSAVMIHAYVHPTLPVLALHFKTGSSDNEYKLMHETTPER